MGCIIHEVISGSPAQKAGVQPGWKLLAIQGHAIQDVLDYYFYALHPDVRLLLEDEEKRRISLQLENEEDQDLGLVFESYLMDRQRCCRNHCIFCFINQLPKGMRKSLYFKDDDDRLSFLFGNYITLTNLSKEEIRRIRKRKISPINVSVHTMNPKLRNTMMGNPQAGKSLRLLRMLDRSGVSVNCQLVLCPGINDGKELQKSLKKLRKYKHVESIAAVPVGITDHRKGLYPLKPYTREQAKKTVDCIEKFHDTYDLPVFAADELYLLAGRPVKEAAYYGDFSQLENGVGMLALFEQEAGDAIWALQPGKEKRCVSLATGYAAYPMIQKLLDDLQKKWHNFEYHLYPIQNRFFGKRITVAGLLTGTDLAEQLQGKMLGERLFLADAMLDYQERYFLDDMTPDQLSSRLGIPITFVENQGAALIDKLTGQSEE